MTEAARPKYRAILVGECPSGGKEALSDTIALLTHGKEGSEARRLAAVLRRLGDTFESINPKDLEQRVRAELQHVFAQGIDMVLLPDLPQALLKVLQAKLAEQRRAGYVWTKGSAEHGGKDGWKMLEAGSGAAYGTKVRPVSARKQNLELVGRMGFPPPLNQVHGQG